MLKFKGDANKFELVRLPYQFKFQDTFNSPYTKWLEMIESTCSEILGNYTKEEQLMTVAFGNREKQRSNRVMDALEFDYQDYEKFEEVGGAKRKIIVSIMKRHAIRSAQEDKKKNISSKKQKNVDEGESSQSGPKSHVHKKRKPSKPSRANMKTPKLSKARP